MNRTKSSVFATAVVFSLAALIQTPLLAQGEPSFAGHWVRNPDESDDAEEKIQTAAADIFNKATRGGRNILTEQIRESQQRLQTVLSIYVQFAETLYIEDEGDELHVDDGAGTVRIFYLDGKEHIRQTSGGAKLETICNRRGNQVTVQQETKGAKIFETYELASDGGRMTLTVRLETKQLKEPLILKNIYDLDY